MKGGIDLDQLRSQWTTLDVPLEARLRLDVAALRAQLTANTAMAFQRHAWWQSASLLLSAVVLAMLCVFIVRHFFELPLLISGMACAAVALAQVLVDVREIVTLRTLDYASPIDEVLRKIGALRMRRLRLVKWIFLLAASLSLPAAIVLVKAAFTIDLYEKIDKRFLLWHQLVGLACIPVLMLLGNLAARWFKGSPRFERLIDELGGMSWVRAQGQLSDLRDFERDLDNQGASRTFNARARRGAVARAVQPELRALTTQLTWRLGCIIAAMAGVALFNLHHGANPWLLLPALTVHFVLVAHLVANIVQLAAVRGLALHEPLEVVQKTLQWLMKLQLGLVRGTLLIAPMLLVPVAVVVARAALHIDLFTVLSIRALAIAEAVSAAAAALLTVVYFRYRADATNPPELIDRIAARSTANIRSLMSALARVPQDTGTPLNAPVGPPHR